MLATWFEIPLNTIVPLFIYIHSPREFHLKKCNALIIANLWLNLINTFSEDTVWNKGNFTAL